MDIQPRTNHFQPWNDPGEGYKFGDFVNPIPARAPAESAHEDTVHFSSPPPPSKTTLAFQPWVDDGEGYKFSGWA